MKQIPLGAHGDKNGKPTPRTGSVQHTFCPIQEVKDEALCLKMGGTREWLAVLEVGGINARLRSEEEQYQINEQFQQLLVALAHPLQILMRVTPIDLSGYLSSFILTPEQKKAMLYDADPTQKRMIKTWMQLATSHVQFMKNRAADQTLLSRRFYLVVPALSTCVEELHSTALARMFHLFRPSFSGEASKAAQEARARHQLTIRCEALERKLVSMSLSARRLSNNELIELEAACLQPCWTSGLATRALEQADEPNQSQTGDARGKPLSSRKAKRVEDFPRMEEGSWSPIADRIAPASIQVSPGYTRIEEDYVQVLDVHTLPRQVGPTWFSQLMRIDEVMDVSLFYIPQPKRATMRALHRKRFEMHSSTMIDTEQDRYPDPERVAAQADIENLMDRVATGGDRVLAFAMHVLVRGASLWEMRARANRIRAMLYSMQLGARIAYFEQEKGVRSCLPHARSELRTSEHPLILGSHEASSTFPFLEHSLFEETGILEGMSHTGEPIAIDWWSKRRPNANRLIVGPSGVGKTFKVHLDIDRLLLRSFGTASVRQREPKLPFQCIIVDIEREFRRQTLERGGEWIRLAPGTRQCINPFDLPQTNAHTPRPSHQHVEYHLCDKIADLHALLDVMLAEHDEEGRGRLTSWEKGLLDQALSFAYDLCGITDDPATHHHEPPLMRDLYDILKSEVCGKDDTGLSDRLQRFVSGSLSGLFSGQTNVALDRPLECFDIHDLPTDLRPIAIYLLSSHVWNRSFGSTTPIVFVVDELASLFQYEEGRRFLEALFQRARKHYLSVVGVTQYVGILERSSIPTNCATTIIMAQEAASLDLVQRIFHLGEAEVQELRTFGKGEALLLMGEQHVAVRFLASESEYRIATSDPSDLAEAAQGHEEGYTTNKEVPYEK
jgi:hypothetical protein